MTEHPSRMHMILRWLAGGLVVVALSATAAFHQMQLGREVNHLPEPERRALYHRTLETLKTTCTNASGPTLREYCREQAEFMKDFSECDDSCRALVLQLTITPPR
jgi:hypothetical protein